MIRRVVARANLRRLPGALVAGGFAIVAIAVLTIVLSAIALGNYHQNVDSRARSREVLLSAKDLQASLRGVETAAWRFAFTGDPAYLDRHQSADASVTAGLAELTALTAGVDYQRARVVELQPLIPEALAQFASAMEIRHASGSSDAALSQLNSPTGHAAMDTSQQVLTDMTTAENQHIARLTASTDTRAQMMTYTVSSLALVNVGLLVVVALYLRSRNQEALLRRSNESKDQFIGLVSHELRNPIAAIMGAASVLHGRGASLGHVEQARLIEGIEEDAARLDRRIGNMLLVARRQDEEGELEPLLLQRLIPRVVALHRGRFPNRIVNICAGDALPPVNGDPSYFEEILLNLLGNAEKYGDPSAAIEVEARTERDSVRVAVLDRGEGIEPALAEHLFEPFVRAESAIRTASGAGLGLAVCRRLVEMQGGRISAAPREGGGSIFAFTLPLVPDFPSADAGSGAVPVGRRNRAASHRGLASTRTRRRSQMSYGGSQDGDFA